MCDWRLRERARERERARARARERESERDGEGEREREREGERQRRREREILSDPEQNIPKRDWEFQLYFAKQQFRTLLELLGKAPPGLV